MSFSAFGNRSGWSGAVLRIRRRSVLRAGFGAVIALSLLSAVEALRVQRNLSTQAAEIYRLHIQQDDILFRLRRTLWLGAIAGRDFLLDPHAGRVATFTAQLAKLRADSAQLLDGLERTRAPRASCRELRSKVDQFWNGLEPIPVTAQNLSAAERYDFVQRDLVPRRDTVGDGLWEFTRISQKALEDNELQFAGMRRSTDLRLFLTLGMSVVLGLIVAGFSLLHSGTLERQASRQYQEVAAAKADLERLSARLIEIQEQERKRLSAELHDRIGQALATLRLEIARAESVPGRRLPEVRQRLADARALAEDAIQVVRDISLVLRPALLDDLGLRPALQWLTEDFRRRTGITCDLNEQGPADALPEDVRTCVYRVVQEALHNCEKHAAALWVRVSIAQAAGLVTVTVEDDGCGFDPSATRTGPRQSGLGILGMRERAAALGGEVEVNSTPGKGTRLTLRLPVRAEKTGRPVAGAEARG